MSCDDYCCNYGCNQGRNCPARKTQASQRAIDEQAKTDRQCCTGNCRQGRDCTRPSYGMLDVVKDVALVLVVVAIVAASAGWVAQNWIGWIG